MLLVSSATRCAPLPTFDLRFPLGCTQYSAPCLYCSCASLLTLLAQQPATDCDASLGVWSRSISDCLRHSCKPLYTICIAIRQNSSLAWLTALVEPTFSLHKAHSRRPLRSSRDTSNADCLQGGYSDASSAAAAAREYYLQAKLASEAAERWAQGKPCLPYLMCPLHCVCCCHTKT